MEPTICKEKGAVMHPNYTHFGGCDADIDWLPKCNCIDGQCNYYVLTGCGCGTNILEHYNIK
tara:strand:- start:61 stop:246 length:186 start_codon:yes stop_codon:yes gene_type:complete